MRASRQASTAILIALFISVSSPGPAAARARKPDFSRAIKAGRALMTTFVQKAGIPGLAVAVGRGDEVFWAEDIGLAQLEHEVPVTPTTRFRIASVSKLFTGTAVARLASRGRLDLDRSISTYIEDAPAHWEGITARHLVSHTSGIGHYESPEDALEVVHYETTAEALKKFRDRPLKHAPGADETYSSFAYTALAAVIEGATGKDYLTFMQEEIFTPLGMAHTVPDDPRAIIAGRTGFYEKGPDGGIVHSPPIDLSGRWAGSGFLSTSRDLLRFGAAHASAGFLDAATLKLIATRQPVGEGEEAKEGFGWGPRTDWDDRPYLWGDGSTPGAACGLLVYTDSGVTVSIAANLRGAPLQNGEFIVVAQRFIAELEGVGITDVPRRDLGSWEADVTGPGVETTATLEVTLTAGRVGGRLQIAGSAPFEIVDGFQSDGRLWLITLDPRGSFLPLRFERDGEDLSGKILRTNFTLRARRSKQER